MDESRLTTRTLEERVACLEGRLDARAEISGRPIKCGSDKRPSIEERVAYLEGRLAGRAPLDDARRNP